jgi:SecD/SecF fusion protein
MLASTNFLTRFLKDFFENPLTLFLVGLSLLILFFWYFATDIERRKRNVGTILLIGICGLCAMAIYPPKERLKGGIDILGGSAFSLRVQPQEDENGDPLPVSPDQVDQAISIIEKRLNAMGGQDSMIARQGTDMIIVQMPGVEPEEAARIRTTLEKTAKLEFREVSPRNEEVGADGKKLAQRVADGTEIVPGYRAYTHKYNDQDGNERTEPILLNRRPSVTGKNVSFAAPSQQQSDAVDITLNGEGTEKMIALTENMRRGIDRIAIVLDGEVISAPAVNQTPLGKRFIIEGLSDPGEPMELAKALRNPLENSLSVEEERSVSATLGKAIIEQGTWSGIIGLAITFVFVLFYYRLAGTIALFGLVVNGVILFGTMAMFGFTFTLPGIAGMILTIGMAVDANVLIYERLREEINGGKSLKNAIAAAYEKAFTAIFDSNLTSLITAVILFWMASGTIKGFAVTLTIGILASMFSSILVTRVLFRWGVDTGLLRKLSFMNLIKPGNYDFLGKRKMSAIFSLILIGASVGGYALHNKDALGIDFTGGTLIQFQLGETEIPLDDVNSAIGQLTLTRAAYAQEESNPATGTLLSIRCDKEDSINIENKLREAIPTLAARSAPTDQNPEGEYTIAASKEEVSALIGMTFLKESLIALAFGLFGILIYITVRFEFSFAIGAFAALLHDVIISVGLIVLFGNELSLIHVGAILTIAGYSINDTIVVFDRIRESLLYRRGSVEEIMNEAINATLSRTVLTSATTIVTVSILSFFGGSQLRDFSLVILIGLVVGTYSSIFVASPIVLWWSSRKGGNLRRQVQDSIALETDVAAAGN